MATRLEDAVSDPNVDLSNPNVTLKEDKVEEISPPEISTQAAEPVSTGPVSTGPVSTEPVSTGPVSTEQPVTGSEFTESAESEISEKKNQIIQLGEIYNANVSTMPDGDKKETVSIMDKLDKKIQVKSLHPIFKDANTDPSEWFRRNKERFVSISDNTSTDITYKGDIDQRSDEEKKEEFNEMISEVKDPQSGISIFGLSMPMIDTSIPDLISSPLAAAGTKERWDPNVEKIRLYKNLTESGVPVDISIFGENFEVLLTDTETERYNKLWDEKHRPYDQDGKPIKGKGSAGHIPLLDMVLKSYWLREFTGVPADKTTLEHLGDTMVDKIDSALETDEGVDSIFASEGYIPITDGPTLKDITGDRGIENVDWSLISTGNKRRLLKTAKYSIRALQGLGMDLEHFTTTEGVSILATMMLAAVAAPEVAAVGTLGFLGMMGLHAYGSTTEGYAAFQDGDYDKMFQKVGSVAGTSLFGYHMGKRVPHDLKAIKNSSIFTGKDKLTRYSDYVKATMKSNEEVIGLDDYIAFEAEFLKDYGRYPEFDTHPMGLSVKMNGEAVKLNNLKNTKTVNRNIKKKTKDGRVAYEGDNFVPESSSSHPFSATPGERVSLERPSKGGGDFKYSKDRVTNYLANTWRATPINFNVKLDKVKDASLIKQFDQKFKKDKPSWKRSSDGNSVTFSIQKNPKNLTIEQLMLEKSPKKYKAEGYANTITEKPVSSMNPVEYRIRQEMMARGMADLITKYPDLKPFSGEVGFNVDLHGGWWTKHIDSNFKALEKMGFNEIKNPQMKQMYNLLLSFTSQGMNLEPNFKAANFLLQSFIESGDIKYSSGFKKGVNKIVNAAESTEGINIDTRGATKKNIAKMRAAVEHLGGWQQFYDWLFKEQPAGVLKAQVKEMFKGIKEFEIKEVSGLKGKADAPRKGYHIFGPKIGEMFAAAEGKQGDVPIDLWMVNLEQILANRIGINRKRLKSGKIQEKYTETPDAAGGHKFNKGAIEKAVDIVNDRFEKGEIPPHVKMSKPINGPLEGQPLYWVRIKHLYEQFKQNVSDDDYRNAQSSQLARFEKFKADKKNNQGLSRQDFFNLEVLATTKEGLTKEQKKAGFTTEGYKSPRDRYLDFVANAEKLTPEQIIAQKKQSTKRMNARWGINIVKHWREYLTEQGLKPEDLAGLSIKDVKFESKRLLELLERKGVNLGKMTSKEKINFVETLVESSAAEFNGISDLFFMRYIDEKGSEKMTKSGYKGYLKESVDALNLDASIKREFIGLMLKKYDDQSTNVVETLQTLKRAKTGKGGVPKNLSENYSSNINLTKMPSTSQGILNEVVRVLGDNIIGESRTYRSWAETERGALAPVNIERLMHVMFNEKGSTALKDIGYSDWIFDIKGRKNPSLAVNDQKVIGARYITEAIMQDYTKNPTPEKYDLVLKAVNSSIALNNTAGRTLQSLRMKTSALTAAKLSEDMLALIEKEGFSKDPTWADKVLEYNRNMKLASLSSVTRSTVGNTINNILLNTDIPLEGAADAFLNRIGNVYRKMKGLPLLDRRDRFAIEILGFNEGQWAGKQNALVDAFKMLKEDAGILKDKGLYERDSYSDMMAIGGKWGQIIRTPQRAQGAIDIFFRTIFERGMLYRLAYRDAMNRKIPFDFDVKSKFQKSVKEFLENPTPAQIEYAKNSAEYSTFQQQQYGIFEFFNRIRTGDSGIGKVGQFMIPFYNTHANILRSTIERSPFTLTQGQTWQAIKTYKDGINKKYPEGEVTGPLASKLAKVGTGAVTLGLLNLGHSLLEANIEGSWSNKSGAERNQLRAQGRDAYTIELTDKDGETTSYSYLGYEPLATFIRYTGKMKNEEEMAEMKNLIRAFAEDYNYEPTKGQIDFLDRVGMAGQTFLYDFRENPVFQGINSVYETLFSINNPDDASKRRRSIYMLSDLARGFLLPNVFSQSRAISDPLYRKILIDNEEAVLKDDGSGYFDQLLKGISSQVPSWTNLDKVIKHVGTTKDNYPRLGAFGDLLDRKSTASSLFGIKWWSHNPDNLDEDGKKHHEIRRLLYNQMDRVGLKDVNFDISDIIRDIPISEEEKFLYEVSAGTQFYSQLIDTMIDQNYDQPTLKHHIKSMDPKVLKSTILNLKSLAHGNLMMQLFPSEQILGKAFKSGDYLFSLDALARRAGLKDGLPEDTYEWAEDIWKESLDLKMSQQRQNRLNNAKQYADHVNKLMTESYNDKHLKTYFEMKGHKAYVPWTDMMKYPNMTVKELKDPDNDNFNELMKDVMFIKSLRDEQ